MSQLFTLEEGTIVTTIEPSLSIDRFIDIATHGVLVRCNEHWGAGTSTRVTTTIEGYFITDDRLYKLVYVGAFPEYDIKPPPDRKTLTLEAVSEYHSAIVETIKQLLYLWPRIRHNWSSDSEVAAYRNNVYGANAEITTSHPDLMEHYAALQALLREGWIQVVQPGPQTGNHAVVMARFFERWTRFRERQRALNL